MPQICHFDKRPATTEECCVRYQTLNTINNVVIYPVTISHELPIVEKQRAMIPYYVYDDENNC